jgi:hypothetical protein
MNQCIRLANYLKENFKSNPMDEIKKTLVGFISVLGNLRSVINNY